MYMCVNCCLIFYSLSKKLVFVPVVRAVIVAHSNRLVLASIVQWPEIPLASRAQVISTDLLLHVLTDGHTPIILV